MKKFSRVIALLLCVMMLIGMLPTGVFAAEEEAVEYKITAPHAVKLSANKAIAGDIINVTADDTIEKITASANGEAIAVSKADSGYSFVVPEADVSVKVYYKASAIAALQDSWEQGNPFLPLWDYNPDTEPHVFEDPDNPGQYRLYFCTSHDMNKTSYCSNNHVLYSCPVDDPFNWTYHGIIVGPDHTEHNDTLYAPDMMCVEDPTSPTGKYYYYIPCNQGGGRQSMILRSSRPDGKGDPFTVINWSNDNHSRTTGLLTFDPSFFVDDDGKVYGYWGGYNSTCHGAQLDPATNFTTAIAGTQKDDMLGDGLRGNTFGFYEASSMRKVGDTYVFVYSRVGKNTEPEGTNYNQLGYAYSDSPLGPWTFGGIVVDAQGEVINPSSHTRTFKNGGNTHGSLVKLGDQWYTSYHRNVETNARQAMFDPVEITVNEDGSVKIKQAEMTSQGFYMNGLNPYKKHSIGTACYFTGDGKLQPLYEEGTKSLPINNVRNNTIIGLKYFDFNVEAPEGSSISLNLDLIPRGAGTINVWLRPESDLGVAPFSEDCIKIGSYQLTGQEAQEMTTIEIETPDVAKVDGKWGVFYSFANGSGNIADMYNMQFEFADHEHVYQDVVTAPTCLEGGYTSGICEICGKAVTRDFTDPLGHDWDNGTVTVAPTETSAGVLTIACTRCDATKTKRIPRIGATVPDDIDFTDPAAADQFEIVNKASTEIRDGQGLYMVTTKDAFETANGQLSGNAATTPKDLVIVPVEGDWQATLQFVFNKSANNGYYQFFGFYAMQDYDNCAGIRGGDGALQNFLRIGGNITADSSNLNSAPGLANNGETYWFRIVKEGDTYTCYRSSDGEEFTEMFAYENTGIEAEKIAIDAYTGMTEGYSFLVKSLTFEDVGGAPLGETYKITAPHAVKAPAKAASGSKVIVEADDSIDRIVVTAGDKNVAVSKVDAGFSFVMPEADVSMKVYYKANAVASLQDNWEQGNPFLPLWDYNPDTEPHVFEDPDNPGQYRLYFCTSHDMNKTSYCSNNHVLYSCPVDDPFNWTYHGVIVGQEHTEHNDTLYAPDMMCVEDPTSPTGKYYYYIPCNQAGGRQTMILRSSRPDGKDDPFTVINWADDSHSKTTGLLTFDPSFFVDDDGKVYGYWGGYNSTCHGAQLDPATNFTTAIEGIQKDDMLGDGLKGGTFSFYEASSMRKIENTYVFVYSRQSTNADPEGSNCNQLGYAYSDSPLGPWTFGGILVDAQGEVLDPVAHTRTFKNGGNTHGSLVKLGDQWYVSYHRNVETNARQAMFDPVDVTVNEDGSVVIKQAEMTSQGFYINGLNPYKKHSIGTAAYFTGDGKLQPLYEEGTKSLPFNGVRNNTILGLKYFDFNVEAPEGSLLTLNLDLIPRGVGTINVWLRPESDLGVAPFSEDCIKIGSYELTGAEPQEMTTIEIETPAIANVDGKWGVFYSFENGDGNIADMYNMQFEFSDHEHVYKEVVTAPTCLENGYTTGVCEICGKVRVYDRTLATGHTWNGVVTTEPTEISDGVMTYTCVDCGLVKTARIPRIGSKVPADIVFSDPADADKYEIVNKATSAIVEDEGLSLVSTTRSSPEATGDAFTPSDLISIPVGGNFAATLKFQKSGGSTFSFFGDTDVLGFYLADDNDNFVGVRAGNRSLVNLVKKNGVVTTANAAIGASTTTGMSAAGTYWFRIEKNGSSVNVSWSTDGENFTDIFVFETTGLVGKNLIIDAYNTSSWSFGGSNSYILETLNYTEILEPTYKLGPTVVKDSASPTGYVGKFIYFDDEAEQVYFCGDLMLSYTTESGGSAAVYSPFDYQPGMMRRGGSQFKEPMKALGDGYWYYELPLTAGANQYWFNTESNTRMIPDPANHPQWSPASNWNTKNAYNAIYVPYDEKQGNEVLKAREIENPREGQNNGTWSYVPYKLSEEQADDYYMGVYLPYGYDADRAEPYKTIYVLHGGGQDESDWLGIGSVQNIIDNLYADGRIEDAPILIVPRNTRLGSGSLEATFAFVENSYNVSTDRMDRAICGLSMGGMMINSLLNDDKKRDGATFGYYGFFSGGNPSNALNSPYLLDSYYYVGSGLYEGNPYNQRLVDTGASYHFTQFAGAHDFNTWCQMFTDFAENYAFKPENFERKLFNDVDTNAYYYNALKWAVDNGITNGFEPGLFAPDNAVTRAQIVTMLWRAAGCPAPAAAATFKDLKAGEYYVDAVAWAVENGITNGVGKNMFAPNDICTRGQIVTFLWRYMGQPKAEAAAEFSDVPADEYYADAIAWAVEAGVTEGYPEGIFKPTAECTRAQAVTFIQRAIAD